MLLTPNYLPLTFRDSGIRGVRFQLQRRDREGIAPSSLNPCSAYINVEPNFREARSTLSRKDSQRFLESKNCPNHHAANARTTRHEVWAQTMCFWVA